MILDKVQTEIINKYNPITRIFFVEANGEFFRFDHHKKGDKAIWVVGSQWTYKGNIYWSVNYGSWKDGNRHIINSWKDAEVDTNFKKNAAKKQKELLVKLEYEIKKKNLDCKEKWEPIFKNIPDTNKVHPYMVSKGFSDNGVAKIDKYGNLLIPAYKESGFVGLQRIYEQDGKFVKRYTSGIEKQGSFCPIGKFKNAPLIFVSEGYATAKSVYEATKKPSICVWDCGNIIHALHQIKSISPKSKIIICADDDTNNDPRFHKIGEKKARAAAKRFSNCIVKLPKFGEIKNDSWTDFNDLHVFVSLEEVKKQLDCDVSEFKEIILKGHSKDGKMYYYNTETMSIAALTPMEHTNKNLLAMAEGKYWGDRFKYKKDNEGNNTGQPDWDFVIEQVFKEQRKVGFFDFANIRGYGVHADNNNIVVNLGDSIYFNREIKPIHGNDIKTKYFYEADKGIDIDFNEELNDSEGEEIISAFKSISYKNSSDYIIMCGFIAMAQVFGALKWRPQIWLTGSKGSGKTTILSYIRPLIPFCMRVDDSTAAGIRQEVQNNTYAIIYDESEPNSEKARKVMTEIMELARQSSSLTDSMHLRGSASGKSVRFKPNIIFMFSSIQKFLPTVADISRFYPIELMNPKGHTESHYRELEKKMESVSRYGHKLFARMVNNFDTFQENINICRKILKEMKYESRQADQLAPLVAGYHFIGNTENLSRNDAEYTINRINFRESDYIKDNNDDESAKCLDTILDSIIPGQNKTIGQTIAEYKEKPAVRFHAEDLDKVGIRYFLNEEELFICSNHHQLNKLLEKTMYSDYAALLRRHENFVESRKTCRIAKKVRRGITIKLEEE
jgi:phage/plasmid primase-like uncharacterized protein